jgi:hypothetical protein
MLKLPLKIANHPLKTKNNLAQNFSTPLIFYGRDSRDSRNILIHFYILDFARKNLQLIDLYSEENSEKIPQNLYTHPAFRPHSCLKINAQNDFLCFIENGKYFYKISPTKSEAQIITPQDLDIPHKEDTKEFGSTFFIDPENPQNFILSTLVEKSDRGISKKSIHYFSADLQLQNFQAIFSHPKKGGHCPHTTRKIKNIIYNSIFDGDQYQLKKSQEIFTKAELTRHIYRSLYKEFCQLLNQEFTEENFQKSIQINIGTGAYKTSADLDLYLQSRFQGKNFKAFCDSEKEFAFHLLPGEIMTYNPKTKESNIYDTHASSPAHFETDLDEKYLYVSSHNHCVFGKRLLFGPGAIDKFEIQENSLKYISTFFHQKYYRFTSHKILKFQNKNYLATFAKPNRLLFIDTETMTENFHHDFGENYLDHIPKEKICDTLNKEIVPLDEEFIALEVSDDQSQIFIVGRSEVLIFSMEEKKIIEKIPLPDLGKFRKIFVTHTQKL